MPGFCGGNDALNDSQLNIERQLSAYRAAGLQVDSRIYPGGRHEMLNETNREEVMDDLITWLEKHCPG